MFICIIANKQGILNFYGHTHQEDNFYNGNPYMYHVGMDSHNLTPISIDEILEEVSKAFHNIEKI